MPNGYHEPQKYAHPDDGLSREVATNLKNQGINVEPLTDDEYQQLEPFDWDVDKHLDEAGVRLTGQNVDILHVVTLPSKGKGDSREVIYKAKFLLECPENLLESIGKKDEPFSVSFKVKRKGLFGRGEISGFMWQSDCGTKLERRFIEMLNLDTSLGDNFVSSGHTNVNAWLQENHYVAINTEKVYTQSRDIGEFLDVANIITKRLKDFH